MDVAAAWMPMLAATLQRRTPSEAQLDALYAGNSARVYRVR